MKRLQVLWFETKNYYLDINNCAQWGPCKYCYITRKILKKYQTYVYTQWSGYKYCYKTIIIVLKYSSYFCTDRYVHNYCYITLIMRLKYKDCCTWWSAYNNCYITLIILLKTNNSIEIFIIFLHSDMFTIIAIYHEKCDWNTNTIVHGEVLTTIAI